MKLGALDIPLFMRNFACRNLISRTLTRKSKLPCVADSNHTPFITSHKGAAIPDLSHLLYLSANLAYLTPQALYPLTL